MNNNNNIRTNVNKHTPMDASQNLMLLSREPDTRNGPGRVVAVLSICSVGVTADASLMATITTTTTTTLYIIVFIII